MTLIVRPGFQFDDDASTYIEAVEAADTQALETATRYAINDFVIGCKQDGIWSAIKASCILAGARTLPGALVPLAGTAPTNVNFVSGDYNRKTGLIGNGTTKYLNSNRNNNADPQNSQHLTVYVSAPYSAICALAGSSESGDGRTHLIGIASPLSLQTRCRTSNANTSSTLGSVTGLFGVSRNNSANYNVRGATGTYAATIAEPSLLVESSEIHVFQRATVPFPTNARLAFYSIGESLDLALLDTRVSALINAFGVAIP
jgi:hypothetical protein